MGITTATLFSQMSRSYFPRDRAGQIDWHNNFATEFPKVGEKLSFSPTEITNAVNDSRYAAYLLKTLGPELDSESTHPAQAVLEGQSQGSFVDLPSTADAPPPVRPGIDTRRQARVERIKAQTNYSAEIGAKLKIMSDAKFDPKSYKAELGQARQTGPSIVTIPFRKAGGDVAGINLYRQGKNERSPQLVGFFMRTPAIDTTPGKSGQLMYTARAVISGKEIGQPSDIVSVKVG